PRLQRRGPFSRSARGLQHVSGPGQREHADSISSGQLATQPQARPIDGISILSDARSVSVRRPETPHRRRTECMVPVAIRSASTCTANMSDAGERAHSGAEPWSRLWSTGVLHSCATGIHGNYDGAVLEFWQRQFDSLEDGSRLVDVGTGNGALLLLARQRATERGIQLSMHGVDI